MLSCLPILLVVVVPVFGQSSGREYVHAECGSVKVSVHTVE